MLVLTRSDELNRSYCEDNRSPFDNITSNFNPQFDDMKRNSRPLSGGNSRTDEPGANEAAGFSGRESPAFKETRATVISTGTKTITITSAVDPFWLENTRRYEKEKRSSDIQDDKMGSERKEAQGFSQNQGKKKRSVRLVGRPRGKVVKCRFGEVEKIGGGEETLEGTSRLCGSLDKERASVSSATSVQSPETCTTGPNPSPTITAWEAGWNVTNAIQVH